MRHISPQSALRRARRELRLVRGEDSRDGQPCWMVYDLHNNGRGIYGDEAKGQDEYQKRLMFRALELIDPEHDWHEYDWHLLSGPAADQESGIPLMAKWAPLTVWGMINPQASQPATMP